MQLSLLEKNMMRRATIGDALRRNTKRHPNKPLFIFYDQSGNKRVYTYKEVNDKANRFANALISLGIKKGDIVAVMSHNTPHYIICWFGLTKIGAVITGVNFTYKEKEIVYQLNHSEAKVFLVEDSLIDTVQAVKKELISVQHYLSSNITGKIIPEEWIDFDELISNKNSLDEPEAVVEDTDIVMTIYTSGTEAHPKGVMIQHRNYLCATTPSWAQELEHNRDDVYLYFMPFYTIAGLGSITSCIILGLTMVVPYVVDPQISLKIIEEEKVTVTAQTPTFYIKLSQIPGFEKCDLSSLQKCLTYGGLIPRSMIEIWNKFAPQVKWCTYWGQSELSQLGSFGWFKKIEDIPSQDPSWIGKPVNVLEIKVIDDDENEVVSGVGELICRGPSVMLGYYKDDEKTANTVRNGWVHTGDIVRIDKDRNLFFYDRKKDVIKTGGLNVSSYEVQDEICKNPNVAEVAVIGLPDPYWIEKVTAFIVTKAGTVVKEEEILQLCKDNLAGYKVPKSVIFVNELPKDGQGKILKRVLRQKYLG